jgi:hypothetical protein
MSKAWVPMGRGASIEDKLLYRRQQVATATCVTSVTCRCDCLCDHGPRKLRFEIVSSVIEGHERGPFRTPSCTATVSPSATVSHKAWYSHLDLFVKIARALQLLSIRFPDVQKQKELFFHYLLCNKNLYVRHGCSVIRERVSMVVPVLPRF